MLPAKFVYGYNLVSINQQETNEYFTKSSVWVERVCNS